VLVTKSDVRFGGFKPGLLVILASLQQLSNELKEDIMITSGSDGVHMKGSRHYTFEAVDIRSHSWVMQRKLVVKAQLEKIVGPRFTVLLENVGEDNEHIHIQVKKGTKYP
jgi:hypothetical protein